MLEYRLFLFSKYLLKYILIGFILLLIIFLLYNQINDYRQKSYFTEQKNLDLGMYNAVYEISKPNLTRIHAQKSLYANEDRIIFERINAIVNNIHYKELQFLSKQAVFDKAIKQLTFANQIVITSPQGLNVTANQAFYDLDKQVIKASDNVNFNDYMGKIIAHNLTVDFIEQIYNFHGDVVATNDDNKLITGEKINIDAQKMQIEALINPQYQDQDITINADKFVAFYQENQAKKWQLHKIIAYQNIKIISKNTIITANQAEYYSDKKQFLIWDNVKLNRENNFIKGQKLIYNIVTDNFRILSKKADKVNLKFKKEGP